MSRLVTDPERRSSTEANGVLAHALGRCCCCRQRSRTFPMVCRECVQAGCVWWDKPCKLRQEDEDA